MVDKKKSAPETATSGAETKRKSIENSVSDMPKVVKRCTAVHQLNQNERGYIRAVWRWAKTREQLVTELKKLKFCTLEVALKYLVVADYISDEDMKNVLKDLFKENDKNG